MARKSREVRLREAKETLVLWVDAGMENDKSARFVTDMIARLERNKGLSAGQRKYLDSLIEQGAPVVHNADRTAEIERAMATPGMEAMAGPLGDFKYKLSKGWRLSPKQEAFLTSLLEQAKELADNGLPVLTDDERRLVEALLIYGTKRGDWYWQHRQGHYRQYRSAQAFYDTHGTLDNRALSRLKNMFKGAVKTLTEPRFSEGDLAVWNNDAAIVTSDPYVTAQYSEVVQDILCNGLPQTVSSKRLRKRQSRR